MRLVGIVLALVGAVVLGAQGFSYLGRGRTDPPAEAARPADDKPVWESPVVAGIAVVSGLLLLASGGRRE